MKLQSLLFAPLLLGATSLLAQSVPAPGTAATKNDHVQVIEDLFKDTKEIVFEFNFTDRTQLDALGNIVSIDHGVHGNTARAYASKKQFEKFLGQNIPYTIVERPNQTGKKTMMKPGEEKLLGAKLISAYPTYPQYVAMMQQFAIDYPSLCKLYDLGTLPSGRKILALKITDNPNNHENEPQFLYTSSMHGDETAGYPTMLNLIDYLLTNYGTNARVTGMVNNIEIWINPLANPDGTYAAGDATVSGATRANANGVDLNRNYPDPIDGPHPDGEMWQPETQIWMGFADTMNFVASANFHGGAEVANYAWDTKPADHADKNWWLDRCIKFADTCQANGPGSYFNDDYGSGNLGVTNGYAWYEVNGGRQDYMHWWHQCRELTVELSTIKLISAGTFNTMWNSTYRSLLNYIEETVYGIRGIVTDQCTGLPVRAKVFITGHDFDSSHVYSSQHVGNYHRLIAPGTYNVTYSAPGYQPQTITGITVVNNVASVHNVQLVPLAPVANFSSIISPGCSGTVDFADLTGSAASWLWNFGDGNTSTDQNPTHSYAASGTYTVTLTSTNCAGTDAEIKNNYITVSVITAPSTTGASSSTCSPASLNLSASGTGVLNWYNASTGGTLVNTGTTYTTPVLSSTTTYYVESVVTGSTAAAGAASNTMGTGGYFTGASSHYLIFDAYQPFILQSVKVYSNASATRTIELRNSGGTVLQSLSVNIGMGTVTVPLNFNVPAGTDLQLGIQGNGGNFYRNNAGASYPYTLPGVLSITNNSAGNSGYYYFYYDWQVQTSCNSARTPVTATISGIAGDPNVTIGATDLSVCPNTPVTFMATPTNGGSTPSYQWTVNGNPVGTDSPTYMNSALSNGDVVGVEMVSSDPCISDPDTTATVTVSVFAAPATPAITLPGSNLQSDAGSGNQWYLNGSPIGGATATTYTPLSNGDYYVIVTDANGCTSDTSNTISITTLGINALVNNSGFTVYPNPAQNMFTLNTGFSTVYQVNLIDNLGQLVWTKTCEKSTETFALNNLEHGLYFVQVNANGKVYTQKLVIR